MKKQQIKPAADTSIKMVLSVPERINFGSILPEDGDIVGLYLREALLKRVGFTQEEVKDYSIQWLDANQFKYNSLKPQREFRFEVFEMLFIQQGARVLNERKLLKPFNFRLAERMLAINIKSKE